MYLPSTPQIQTVIDEIDADYGKVKELPLYALFYKIHLYPFLKSFDRWITEMEISSSTLVKRYRENPQPDLGNAIAVIDEFLDKYRQAKVQLTRTMQALQPVGTDANAIVSDIESRKQAFSDDMEHIERLIDMFGPIQDNITPEEISGINK